MNDENFVSFGEQGAQLTYGSYLRLPQLLDAQHLESDPPAHDELLFITIHQVYELWFKQLLHEVTAARDAMTDGEVWWAQHLLGRVHVIERVLVHQVDVLETMTPQDFLEFRQRLAPASGFQSVQFRELEFVSGAQDGAYLDRFRGITDDEQHRLRRRLAEPTLWDAFLGVLRDHDLPASTDEEVKVSLRSAAHERSQYGAVWALAEALLQHDELAASWRARHVVMVERMIGSKSGTGGSSGSSYLRGRLAMRYFPLLWDLRSELCRRARTPRVTPHHRPGFFVPGQSRQRSPTVRACQRRRRTQTSPSSSPGRSTWLATARGAGVRLTTRSTSCCVPTSATWRPRTSSNAPTPTSTAPSPPSTSWPRAGPRAPHRCGSSRRR